MRLTRFSAWAGLWGPAFVWAQVDAPTQVWESGTQNAQWAVLAPLVIAVVVWMAWRIAQVARVQKEVRKLQRNEYGVGPLLWAALTLLAGLVLTIYRVQSVEQALYNSAWLQFQQQVDRVEGDVQAQFDRVLSPLRALRASQVAGGSFNRREFEQWAESQRIDQDFYGVLGVGIIERVPRADLGAFIRQQKLTGNPGYAVRTEGNAPDLFVIKSIEPMAPNQAALGYDIGSERQRREAAERAMREAVPALTGGITLVQDGRKLPGFLYFLPMYTQARVSPDMKRRLASFKGWAYSPIVLADLMVHTSAATQGLSDFQLYEGRSLTPSALVYDSANPKGAVPQSDPLDRVAKRMFSVSRPLFVGGQTFQLHASSTEDFERQIDQNEISRLAFTGSALSVLAGAFLWVLLIGRARAVSIARDLTKDLERLAMVAQHTSNAVVMTDAAGQVVWVNEGFTRITGFCAEEVLGKTPGSILQCEKTDPAAVEAIRAAIAAQRPCKQFILNRSKQGHDYWVDLEIQPLRNERQELTGFMAIESDVTDSVEAKRALAQEKERADNILTGTNVGTWESNLVTGEFTTNARWSLMMGFERGEVLPDAEAFWLERLHPDDRIRINNAMDVCIAGKEDHYSCDVRVQRKDGSWMWILRRAQVMARTATGAVEWLGGIHTDISDVKNTEINLRDMESFLERTGRVAGIGAWQVNLRTNEIVWNDQTCDIHGVEPGYRPTMEDALGFYPPRAREQVQVVMARAIEMGSNWDLTTEFVNARGKARWVRSVGEVEFDDSGAVRLLGAFQDVTKERDAQRNIERSEAIFREAIATINEAFVLYDPDDRLVFCNEKYKELYAVSADLIVPGATFESIVRGGAERGQYAEAVGRIDEWVEECLAVHRASNINVEQRLGNGKWLRIVERKLPDGHIVGFRVDITQLKNSLEVAEAARAALAHEQARLKNILEGTNVGTWEWNLQTGETTINARWAAITGYTLQELEPIHIQTWLTQIHPDDLASVQFKVNEHLKGRTAIYESEGRMRHKDGHWVWVHDRGKVQSWSDDGKPLTMAGTHMDITARKQAELKLAQTSSTLQAVLDSAVEVAIIATDLDRKITVFNRGAENLLGYPAHEMLGYRRAGSFFEPLEISVVRETLELSLGRAPSEDEIFLQVAQTSAQTEWTFVRKDGGKFAASLLLAPMYDANADTTGYLAVAYDISRQKEYEFSLKQAMLAAEQSSVAKSQFLANMSHEIRTPMNAILGMLKLLHNTPLSDRQRDYADKTEGAARSLLGLLNDILDFSKVEAGKMQLDPEPFSLQGLLGDLSVILSSNRGAKDVDILFDIDSDIPDGLVGDALRLKQILINLGGNAVKFTPAGEVVIAWKLIRRDTDRIRVGIAIRDSGIGIAPENQVRIFEAFSQAESNTTRRFGGTGLGLVISTRLIRLMGGELQLHSVVGEGSTFSFELDLPLGSDAPLVLQKTETLVAPGMHTLLVDDNPTALATCCAMMEGMGWQVLTASSGSQAMQVVRDSIGGRKPGLSAIFADWQMPDMDGWQTLRDIRRLYADAVCPRLVMLSGQGRELLGGRSSIEQELLDGFLVKPVTATMLRNALDPSVEGEGANADSLSHEERSPGAQRLLDMRILVVEDNPINQQVAFELLTAEGAQVTLAGNGQLGVDAVAAALPPFDVVLMDLQMPVMDGLSAARAIRLGLDMQTLPVIAMTANAMASDREACLAAGMNDHVGKPFDLDNLVAVLQWQTHWKPTPVRPDGYLADAASKAVIDWPAGMDGTGALARMGGNRGLMARATRAYVEDASAWPARVTALIAGSDWSAAERELHSFKGLSGTLGLTDLAGRAAAAESMAHHQDPDRTLVQAVAQIQAQLQRLSPALSLLADTLSDTQGLQSNRAANVSSGSGDSVVLPALAELLVLLKTSDMRAMELHATLPRGDNESVEVALAPLDAAMADLEFELAAQQCEKLIQQWKV